ncbi:MAG: hypothetical protein ACRC28_18435 [Clostridium sp.]|uniref:hypothetical protein n=1 Tax=Clostridium sp. TaxID=1506 RepID=UPI003F2A95A5
MVKIEGYKDYYIDVYGIVYKELKDGLRVCIPTNTKQIRLVRLDNTTTKKTIKQLMIKAFELKEDVVYLDGNSDNNMIDNLVSLKELREEYINKEG